MLQTDVTRAGSRPAYSCDSTAETVHEWAALLKADTSCLVLPSKAAQVAESVEALAQRQDVSMRIMGQKQDLIQAMDTELTAPLVRFIAELMDDYEAFMAPPIIRIRLETVSSRACWKWHQDYTTLRLITTLYGPGTEYLPDPSQPEEIAHCNTGDIGLFKGRLFSGHFGLKGHKACVHRSPPWDENSMPRLLLVIDTPQDFEIEKEAF